jgi:hypothetical protein
MAAPGRINMTNWKADLEALVEEAMAFTKNIRVEPLSCRAPLSNRTGCRR